MRIVLCGGGTGGHVYPLLAARSALLAMQSPALREVATLFIGGSGLEQGLVEREHVPYQSISGGGLHGVGLARAIPNFLRLTVGVVQAWRTLRAFRPQAILATGGYITVPVGLAAGIRRIPLVVYVPDIEPALSVRILGRLGRRVTATAKVSCRYFDEEKFVETGYPVRRALAARASSSTAEARAEFGVDPSQKVLLVFGGSRGARSLNRAISGQLAELLQLAHIIHISGEGWDEVNAASEDLPEDLRARYHVFRYLHEQMGAALAAADLAVARAGAATLGEFPLFGLPSILVPYPHAWRYQRVNAEYLASRGAAVIIHDELLEQELQPAIQRLLNDDAALQAMRESARALARPHAADAIAQVVVDVAGHHR